ncbi:MAG: hypothetical protein JWR19_4310 [Pedosphaera sp.]|nr:hypothetical protein [Pedosphaera sp.]
MDQKPTIETQSKPIVLVVDDEADVRQMIEMYLVREGITCIMAASVEEACLLLKQEKIDLMLLDWKLEKCGIEVLRFCRELYPFMPVIVMSGVPLRILDVKGDAILSEADSFFEKPFAPVILVSHIKRWLKRLAATPNAFLPQQEKDILTLEEYKRLCIRHVVHLLDDNVSVAAEKLDIHRHTVTAMLKTENSPDSSSPPTTNNQPE